MKTVANDWNHPDAKMVRLHDFEYGATAPVIEVDSIHALNQAVGYLKYLNNAVGEIYFRGQSSLYSKLLPSIYRSGVTSSSVATRNRKITEYVRECSDSMNIIDSINSMVKEPLLQHYGIRTRWLDLVNNLWIALWFSIHEYIARTSDRTYEFVVPRSDDEAFGYIILVFSDAIKRHIDSPGVYRGTETDIVDLRIATPSIFLRPHAQHALLIKPRRMDSIEDIDLAKNVCLILQIKVRRIREWIGHGRLLTAENIFPPPVYDNGYSLLLEQAPLKKEDINNFGSITSISYAAPNCG